jgi:hypothetical protein
MVEVSLIIYANQYYDLDHPWSNIEKFIERYSNQTRMHMNLRTLQTTK